MKIIVNPKELEFRNEYDSQLNVYYQGEPFSGVFKYGYEEIEYRLGQATHVIRYFHNGRKESEEYLENGSNLETYTWYEDGTVRSEFKYDYSFFNKPGIVLKTGFSLFPNGKLESKSEKGISKSFSPSGELVVNAKYTPEEQYYKEYYLNGVLKYLSLPSINKSFHYTDQYLLVIDEDTTYGRESLYFDEIRIKVAIQGLFFSEGKEYGFSKHADEIRINRLTTWLINIIQEEKPSEYIELNFILCFCKDQAQAKSAFRRLVNKLSVEDLKELRETGVQNIENEKVLQMKDRLMSEIKKK